jgi:hypothetical protein
MDIFTASAVFIRQKHPGQDKRPHFTAMAVIVIIPA